MKKSFPSTCYWQTPSPAHRSSRDQRDPHIGLSLIKFPKHAFTNPEHTVVFLLASNAAAKAQRSLYPIILSILFPHIGPELPYHIDMGINQFSRLNNNPFMLWIPPKHTKTCSKILLILLSQLFRKGCCPKRGWNRKNLQKSLNTENSSGFKVFALGKWYSKWWAVPWYNCTVRQILIWATLSCTAEHNSLFHAYYLFQIYSEVWVKNLLGLCFSFLFWWFFFLAEMKY